MKLTNVHYKYLENDTWRIYFNDYKECEAFQNERTDGKKPTCSAIFTNTLGIRYYVEAKLTGRFNILRHYVRDGADKYSSSHPWTKLVKKIEGADSDYIFDEIDLWYDATVDKCYFKICCMNGTWTDPFVKIMLNSQFGMMAQANGYYDTDTVGEGGFCTRRSCCGIGIGTDTNKYDHIEKRIIFTVKNFCRGEADIIKVSAWTNTFIGTNKENEKECSWVDFKQYMQKLSATGSDIWDIEYEYDETCPMTGTEVADKIHLYLKPLAYKRLFEKEDKPKQLLKNITDVMISMPKTIGCCTLYYYNLYFNDKSDLKYVSAEAINRSVLSVVKGAYFIRVVSYNKELPKNISSARLVWDQEENMYSVEDFTIKGYRKDDKKIWISTASLWSNNDDYLARMKALTPPPVPYWAKLDTDSKIGFRQKDADELQKEIDEMTKRIYEKLEIKQVKDFDTATAWHEYLTATEMARLGADFDGDTIWVEPIDLINRKEDTDIAEEFIAATLKAKSYSTTEPLVFINHKLMTLTEFIADGKEKEANNKEENNMKIYWDESQPIKANAHFEMEMTAQLTDEQLKVWEAALGIGNQPKHKKEKTVGDVVNEFTEEQKKVLYYLIAEAQKSGKTESPEPTKILVQGTATIIWWSDGTKTVVKCQKGDKMDPEKGIAMCVMKKFMGTNETHSNYLDFAKPAIEEYEKQQAAEKAKKKAEADKRRRAAAKKKGTTGNANYKRGAKAKTEPEIKEES